MIRSIRYIDPFELHIPPNENLVKSSYANILNFVKKKKNAGCRLDVRRVFLPVFPMFPAFVCLLSIIYIPAAFPRVSPAHWLRLFPFAFATIATAACSSGGTRNMILPE